MGLRLSLSASVSSSVVFLGLIHSRCVLIPNLPAPSPEAGLGQWVWHNLCPKLGALYPKKQAGPASSEGQFWKHSILIDLMVRQGNWGRVPRSLRVWPLPVMEKDGIIPHFDFPLISFARSCSALPLPLGCTELQVLEYCIPEPHLCSAEHISVILRKELIPQGHYIGPD